MESATAIENFNIEHLCRLCLEKPGCINIFETADLSKKISILTSITLNILDPLPKYMCENCFQIIELTTSFRDSVVKNDATLRLLFNCQIQPENNLDIHSDVILIDDEDKINDVIENTQVTTQQTIRVREDLFLKNTEPQNNPVKETNISNHTKELPKENHKSSLESKNNESQGTTKEPHQSKKRKTKDEMKMKSTEPHQNSTVPCDLKKVKKEKVEEHVTSCKSEDSKDFKISNLIKFENEPEFSCTVCSKFFTSSKKLALHKRTHLRTFKCTHADCEKRFACKGDLKKHIRTHTGEKPFKCDKCDKQFAQNVTLRSHKQTIHGIMSRDTKEEQIIFWEDEDSNS